MRMSVAIPVYEMDGYGTECLQFNFKKLKEQTFTDFEVVIADHSINNDIERLCDSEKDLTIRYFRNVDGRGNPAINTQFSVQHSQGEIVKLICQDDFLYNENSLQTISDCFTKEVSWLATGYFHTNDRINWFNYHCPSFREDIHIYNTLGTPSCIAVRNSKMIPNFDPTLDYYYDADWYKKLFRVFGKPTCIETVTVVNYLWSHSVTSKMTIQKMEQELAYVTRKHGN